MFKLNILPTEYYDDDNEVFVTRQGAVIQLEHSLVSISKWESKWCKPFLNTTTKTKEETIDYIKCMTITQNVDVKVYGQLTNSNINQINKYIESPMTATTFSDINKSNSREITTSEVIYGCMITHSIPFECQKWHLNRLLTLIKICGIKNSTQKKQNSKDIMSRNRALNEARKKTYNTTG